MKIKIIFLLLICGFSFYKDFGQMTIGASVSPNAASVLDLSNATTLGLYPPQVSLTATNAASPLTSPPTSLLVYNLATAGVFPNNVVPGYYYNAGTAASPNWVRLLYSNNNSSLAWLTLGNNGITSPAAPSTYGTSTFGAAENWIGNIDAKDFAMGTSDIERMRIISTGNIGIGTAAPAATLDINGYNVSTGNALNITANSLTTGTALNVTSSGVITSGGQLLQLNGNSATTGNILTLNANGLTSGNGIYLSSSSTAGMGSSSCSLINLARSGANANASHTAFGIVSSVTNTGASSTNIAGYFTAAGATNNAAINVPSGGGQVIIGQTAAANTNLTMVTAGSTYADNQVSTISLLTYPLNTGYGVGNASAQDIAGAGFEPGIYRPDGNCQVKMTVLFTTNTYSGIQFQLHAFNNGNSYYPIICNSCGDTWTYSYVGGSGSGSTYVATSPWKDFNHGTSAWEFALNEFVGSGQSATILSSYVFVRPKNN